MITEKDIIPKEGILDINCLLRLHLDYDELRPQQIRNHLGSGIWWIKTPQGHTFWKIQHDGNALSKEGKEIIKLTLEKYGYINPSLKNILEEIK